MKNLITKGVMILSLAFSSQAMADFDCKSKDNTVGVDLIHLNVEYSLTNEQPAVMVVYKDGEYFTHHGAVKHFAARGGNMHSYTFENDTKEGPIQFSLDDPKPIFHSGDLAKIEEIEKIKFPEQCGRAGCNPKFPPAKPILKPNPYTSVFFAYQGKPHVLECFK